MGKKKKILAVVAILAIVLISFVGGQAYAKYFTKITGQGMAEVATWDFKVNGEKEQVQEINLISTANNETLVGNKIAPGTQGEFNIVVDGTGSDVGIEYKIEFQDESNKPKNLTFSYDNQKFTSIQELQDKLSGIINANDENKEKTYNITWEWSYETGNTEEEIAANDIIDTKNAQEIAEYTFLVSVTGTQVQPQL